MKPKQRKEATSIAGRAINWLTDKLGITEAPTYIDGYSVERRSEVPFWEGEQGQELKRMGETAKTAGQIGLAGAGFINPFTASSLISALFGTAGAAYGLSLGAQNVYNTSKQFVKDPSSVSNAQLISASLDAIPFAFGATRFVSKLPDVQLPKTLKSNNFTKNEKSNFVEELNDNELDKILREVVTQKADFENPFNNPVYTFNTNNSLLRQRLKTGAADRVGYKWANSPSAGYITSPEKYKPVVTRQREDITGAYYDNDWNTARINLNLTQMRDLNANTENKVLDVYDHELTHLLDKFFRDHNIASKERISIDDWYPTQKRLWTVFDNKARARLIKDGIDITSNIGQKRYNNYMSMAKDKLYQYLSKPTEQIARGVQIKNAAGITDGSKIFTTDEVKQMWENYRQKAMQGDVINNNMNHLYHYLNASNKWDEYTKWFNRAVPAIVPITLGTKMFINQNQKESKHEND